MTQALTGHGKFGRFLHRIKEERTPGRRHCVDHPEDTVEHRVEVCPTWVEYHDDTVEAIGGGDFSRWALIQAIVRSEEGWRAVASICDAVMLAKEAALTPPPPRSRSQFPTTVGAGLRTASNG
ncbi:hypothetical protein PYW07_015992 [Mythimna separata]|uniref:Uncharacterized protein n=1 Tax=Mythimna separata TaxID=271217 RepID=A0AAD8DUY4_MYTSE|nr:hypothetical protein PYW07_015992 [Mythimna separata]